MDDPIIGDPFRCEEHRAAEVLADLGSYTICVNDPPWTEMSRAVAPPARVIVAGDMEVDHLEAIASEPDDGEFVVGFGGGTALDTAKFVAWKQEKPLVQIPTITSVDAGFTDAVGVRSRGRVRYVGQVVPELVVLDVPLVRAAPKRLNRAGVGDVLSCHTGLFDWRLASGAGLGPVWDPALAALGRRLLDQLEAAAPDIGSVSEDGVRFLARAYRAIGAACAAAGHSRFEEGSEHFWAYAYEHATGARLVHGEIIAFAVCALASVQGNDRERARRIVSLAGTTANPADLGVSRDDFVHCLQGLAEYVRAEDLDHCVADLAPPTAAQIADAWSFVADLPRTDID